MAATPPICNFGEAAHAFALPATDGKSYRLADLKGPKGTVSCSCATTAPM